MHAIATHRARIITAPSKPAEPAPATPHAQLSRQAALFRRLRDGDAGGDPGADPDALPQEDGQAPPMTTMETPLFEADAPCSFEAWHRDPPRDDERDGNGRGSHDDGGNRHGSSNDDGDADRSHAQYAIPTLAALHVPLHVPVHTPMPMPVHVPAQTPMQLSTPQSQVTAAHGAPTADRHAARAVTAIEAPAQTGDGMHRLIDSIVAEVDGFCAKPAVVARGNWQITIPVDPALLPGCTLNLALSHFQLTLRFETTDEHSRQLISQHAATLRASLEQVMQSRFAGTRSVEIIVT